MDVAASPKQSQAREEPNESLEISRLFHERAHTQLIGPIDLLPCHRARIHYDRNMFIDRMLFQKPQHGQPVHNRHPMIEHEDARLALRPIAKFSLALKTVEHFLSIAGDDRVAFDVSRIERPFYKDDVIGIIFPEEYPAAMWHIVKV